MFHIDTSLMKLEMALISEYKDDLSDDDFVVLKSEVNGWLNSRDPDYLDAAMAFLAKKEIPIRGLLLKEVGNLANKRISGRVRKVNHRKGYHKHLKSQYKSVFREDKVMIDVFILTKFCELDSRNAYFFAACIYEYGFKGRSSFKRISARTVRSLYEEWKKGLNYEVVNNHFVEFMNDLYPNQSPEEVLDRMLEDIDTSKYEYLLELD